VRAVRDFASAYPQMGYKRLTFVEGAGVTDIRTRVAHPQSNGRLEWLHRTHREKALTEEDLVTTTEGIRRPGWRSGSRS